MKKVILSLVVIFALGAVSCSKTGSTETSTVDSTTVVVDSLATDTVAVVDSTVVQ